VLGQVLLSLSHPAPPRPQRDPPAQTGNRPRPRPPEMAIALPAPPTSLHSPFRRQEPDRTLPQPGRNWLNSCKLEAKKIRQPSTHLYRSRPPTAHTLPTVPSGLNLNSLRTAPPGTTNLSVPFENPEKVREQPSTSQVRKSESLAKICSTLLRATERTTGLQKTCRMFVHPNWVRNSAARSPRGT